MMKKKRIIVLSLLVLLLLSISIVLYTNRSKATNLVVYTSESLQHFNGDDLSKPVLIAYEGYVYDVSPGRNDFYNNGKDYHYLTGRDSTVELNMVGGTIIKSKYKVVGIYKK